MPIAGLFPNFMQPALPGIGATANFIRCWRNPPSIGFVAKTQGATAKSGAGGLVLARQAADEAEILTIAVSSKHARLSIGWRLMQAAIREARSRGGETMFLEVDETNLPAIGLYRKLGFEKAGERKAYYADANGQKSTALVMRRDLR